MTKKDYIKFAEMIKRCSDANHEIDGSINQWQSIAHDTLTDIAFEIIGIFESDNPNFDRERFLKACGLS